MTLPSAPSTVPAIYLSRMSWSVRSEAIGRAAAIVSFVDLIRLWDDAARPPSVLREARVSAVGSSTPVPLC